MHPCRHQSASPQAMRSPRRWRRRHMSVLLPLYRSSLLFPFLHHPVHSLCPFHSFAVPRLPNLSAFSPCFPIPLFYLFRFSLSGCPQDALLNGPDLRHPGRRCHGQPHPYPARPQTPPRRRSGTRRTYCCPENGEVEAQDLRRSSTTSKQHSDVSFSKFRL